MTSRTPSPNHLQTFLTTFMVPSFSSVDASVRANTGPGYTAPPDARISSKFNCIAYAVGVTSRRMIPATTDALDILYSDVGYYLIEDNSAPQNGDAEVYFTPAMGGSPVHAHRIVNAAALTARSKMGEDIIIEHHRNLLQCPRTGGTSYVYGTVRRRYRYDATKLAADQAKQVTTRSGRVSKKVHTISSSSGKKRMLIDDAQVDSNGRVSKKAKK
ncbi:hypothetical protein B7494_g6711 [Chlorociboria aeruginascens]|nr:hypothetical protein B7494_g6711 [Chlorociboria aeruginascens]